SRLPSASWARNGRSSICATIGRTRSHSWVVCGPAAKLTVMGTPSYSCDWASCGRDSCGCDSRRGATVRVRVSIGPGPDARPDASGARPALAADGNQPTRVVSGSVRAGSGRLAAHDVDLVVDGAVGAV